MPKVSGRKQASTGLKNVGRKAIKGVGQALFAGGQIIQTNAQVSLTTGAISGKNHEPSDPGKPPNEDTGFLRSNINVTQRGPLSVRVSSDAPYSAALEEGYKKEAGVGATSFPIRKDGSAKQGPIRREFGSSTVPARPFMKPAAKKSEDEVLKLVRKAVDDALNSTK